MLAKLERVSISQFLQVIELSRTSILSDTGQSTEAFSGCEVEVNDRLNLDSLDWKEKTEKLNYSFH